MVTRESAPEVLATSNRSESNARPDVMTVREAADLLRVERKKIYELVARDQLPGVRRLGRLIRISRAAVLRWLEAC